MRPIDVVEAYSKLRCNCCGHRGPKLAIRWIMCKDKPICRFCFHAWYEGGSADAATVREASLKLRKAKAIEACDE